MTTVRLNDHQSEVFAVLTRDWQTIGAVLAAVNAGKPLEDQRGAEGVVLSLSALRRYGLAETSTGVVEREGRLVRRKTYRKRGDVGPNGDPR